MDTFHTLRLATILTDEFREGGYRRDRIKGYWDGYSSSFSPSTGTDKDAWDDITRRERMAEACYDI
jgi:hypothetical protein